MPCRVSDGKPSCFVALVLILLETAAAAATVTVATAPHSSLRQPWTTITRPDVIIAGGQKCGTTELAANLVRHHQVAGPLHEVHYLDECSGRAILENVNQPCGAAWNASSRDRGSGGGSSRIDRHAGPFRFLPPPTSNAYENCTVRGWSDKLRTLLVKPRPGRLVLDKTPGYIAHADYMRLMHRLAPDAKIIVVLREPVDRAWSAFKMQYERKHVGLQPPPPLRTPVPLPLSAKQAQLSFREEVMAYARAFHGQCPAKPLLQGMFERAMYAEQLEFLFHLYPPENVLVLIAEALWETQDFTALDAFLGLDPPLAEVLPNRTSYWFNKGKLGSLDGDTRAALASVYAEPNQRLCTLLKKHGYRCPQWAPTEYAGQDHAS